MNTDILNYLIVSIAPVCILGIGMILLQITAKKRKHDKGSDTK